MPDVGRLVDADDECAIGARFEVRVGAQDGLRAFPAGRGAPIEVDVGERVDDQRTEVACSLVLRVAAYGAVLRGPTDLPPAAPTPEPGQCQLPVTLDGAEQDHPEHRIANQAEAPGCGRS